MSDEKDKKELKDVVYPDRCPICGITSSYAYHVCEKAEGEPHRWTRCQCGVIFQDKFPDITDVYNAEYMKTYRHMKEGDTRLIHAARTYAPLIEELTYGRMMLDVGCAMPDNMKYFTDRGWLTWGIDINTDTPDLKNIFRGNFETADFDIDIKDEKLKAELGRVRREFDLVWMSHVLEHFKDPVGAMKKAYDLLGETGVLFISTPDIDFINKTGVGGFPHFHANEHYTLWSEQSLKRELEKIGFKVVMCRRNFASRFQSWYDVHIIAQKNYF